MVEEPGSRSDNCKLASQEGTNKRRAGRIAGELRKGRGWGEALRASCGHRMTAARAAKHSHDAVVRPDHAPELRSYHDHDSLAVSLCRILSAQIVAGWLLDKTSVTTQENRHRGAVYVYPWCAFLPLRSAPSIFVLVIQSGLSLHWLDEVDHPRHAFDTASKRESIFSPVTVCWSGSLYYLQWPCRFANKSSDETSSLSFVVHQITSVRSRSGGLFMVGRCPISLALCSNADGVWALNLSLQIACQFVFSVYCL
jgi:hypothetical protein